MTRIRTAGSGRTYRCHRRLRSAAAANRGGDIAERPLHRQRIDPGGGGDCGADSRSAGGSACPGRLSPRPCRDARRARSAQCDTAPESVMQVRFQLNGEPVAVDVEPRMHLADCLRDELRQTGTHLGCEHGACGACTVIVDGAAVRACLMLAVQAEGAEVVTVEGLSNDADLTPLQKSFRKHHALQCGFCTPGMITTAHALLSEEPDCDADRVREVLSGNICRCTGYIGIVDAVLEARASYKK